MVRDHEAGSGEAAARAQTEIEMMVVFFMVSFWNANREERRSREKKPAYQHISLYDIL